MGAGAAKRLSAVRWGVAGNIVVAWVAHAARPPPLIGGATYGVTRLFGTGAAGPGGGLGADRWSWSALVFARRAAAGLRRSRRRRR